MPFTRPGIVHSERRGSEGSCAKQALSHSECRRLRPRPRRQPRRHRGARTWHRHERELDGQQAWGGRGGGVRSRAPLAGLDGSQLDVARREHPDQQARHGRSAALELSISSSDLRLLGPGPLPPTSTHITTVTLGTASAQSSSSSPVSSRYPFALRRTCPILRRFLRTRWTRPTEPGCDHNRRACRVARAGRAGHDRTPLPRRLR